MAVSEQPEVPIQSEALNTRRFSLTSLDRAVIGVIAVLLALIGATILLGDRVGVQLSEVAPLGEAHSTSTIAIRFNETMDHDSAQTHFQTQPALEGSFSWSGATMSFQPSQALAPGSSYTVSLEPGAVSQSGRSVLTEFQFSFTVRTPRVAYLYPADGGPHNIWVVDPTDPGHPTQLTNSPSGIVDFAVSPDGTHIAFTETNTITATSDIKLINLATGGLQQLTNCQNALCSAPVWRPDGKMIAYERVENDPQFGNSPPRIWLLDLTSTPATTQPLFQENQILGYEAQWSADGSRIALVDRGSSSILIYDFNSGKINAITSESGTSGALSPDGNQLIYPDLEADPTGGMLNKLRLFTVSTGEFSAITDPDKPINDQRAAWSPDGKEVAIAREDSRSNSQVVVMDMQTRQITTVTDDPRYANLLFWWDPTGTQLVLQRFPELDANLQPNPNALPEIWTINVSSGEGQKVGDDGFLPRWIP